MVIDSSKNIYVTGYSKSSWGNPYQPFIGTQDAFVAKLNSNGDLVWNTFVGGNDYGVGIALDSSNNIYITGESDSTWGNPIRLYTRWDAFVVKLNSFGDVLWNTFLGGYGSEYGNDILISSTNDIYVLGFSDYPWGEPPIQGSSYLGTFIAKLDATGTLSWHTFIGGPGAATYGTDFAFDSKSELNIVGGSSSSWGSPVQPLIQPQEAFWAKVDGSGNLLMNTFLGGNGDDSGAGIAIDQSDNIYIIGHSRYSWGNPIEPIEGERDAFVAKLTTGNVNQPPVARFTMSTIDQVLTASEGENLEFTVSQGFNSKIQIDFSAQNSTDIDGDPLTYQWNLDGVTTSTSRDFSRDLNEGVHSITLQVMDILGNQSTASGTINIAARNNTDTLKLNWPFVSINNGKVKWAITGYGAGECIKPNGTLTTHCGDDWFAQDWNWGKGKEDRGMVLLSPVSGTVIESCIGCASGYGNEVIIQNQNSNATPYDYAVRFAHMEEVWVTAGQTVCSGTPIGLLGASGSAESPHLHAVAYMGIFQNSDKGNTGYYWLDANGASIEKISGIATPTRFALSFLFDSSNPKPQGCGDTFAVEGQVVDKKGVGLGGVTMTLSGLAISSTNPDTTYGDGSGHYAFNGLPVGNYIITPSKVGCTFTPPNANFTIYMSHISSHSNPEIIPVFKANEVKCK